MPELICEYEIGTRARIAVGDDIEGIITAVIFRSESYHTYELTWVHDGGVKTGWFLAIELKVSEEGQGAAGGALSAPGREKEETTKPAKPKLKNGQTVRIIAETEQENYIGVITGSEAIEGGEWRYGVQLPTTFLSNCTEEELEAVEEGAKDE